MAYRLKRRNSENYPRLVETKNKSQHICSISDEIEFKTKTVRRSKGHCVMIKASIQQENIMITTLCFAPTVELLD